MYNIPYFKEPDEKVIFDFIARHPFAVLNGVDVNSSPVATQVPLFLETEGSKKFLRGHLMRNTDHHKAMLENSNVLVIFSGPHCYVSASWYTDAHQASTWNYMSVYVKGAIRFCGETALENILQKTTLHFENNNAGSPTVFQNLPEEYLKRLMPAIVAFEIEIASIENVFKLSQNRNRQSYLNIMEQLMKGNQNEREIGLAMAERFESLFS